MPPKEKKPKKKPAPKKKRAPRKKTITRIAELPRLPTGLNRDIPPLGGPGGSTNLLAGLASMRPPPPAMPIQTPDQFQIMREQSRQAMLINAVSEEQEKTKKRGGLTVAEVAEELRKRPELYEWRPPAVFSEGERRFGDSLDIKIEPPSPNLKKATFGVRVKMEDDLEVEEPPRTSPPVIGYGPSFEGGAPVRQQGLNMASAGRLRGAKYSSLSLDPSGEGDVAVFMP